MECLLDSPDHTTSEVKRRTSGASLNISRQEFRASTDPLARVDEDDKPVDSASTTEVPGDIGTTESVVSILAPSVDELMSQSEGERVEA